MNTHHLTVFTALNESHIVTPDDSLYDFVCKFTKPQRNVLFNKLCSLYRNSLHDSEIMPRAIIISRIQQSTPYKAKNRHFSTPKRTKTGTFQPLNAQKQATPKQMMRCRNEGFENKL